MPAMPLRCPASGFAALVAVVLSTLLPASEPLRLVASVGGREFTHFVVDRGDLRLRAPNGEVLPAPRAITWRFEGNLSEHWTRIYFFPRFRVVTRGAIEATADVRTHTHGLVWLHRDEAWPQSRTDTGVIVIAWLVGGKPAWIEAMPAHVPQQYSSWIIAAAARELDPTIAVGVPVALLWRDGEFVAPWAVLRSPRLSGVVAALHLGTADEFAQILAGASPRGLDDRNDLAAIVRRATQGSWPDRLERLIVAGARSDDPWLPALMEAAERGRAENVRVLLAAGISPTDKRNTVWQPAEWALGRGHLDVGMALLPEGDRQQHYRALQVALEHGSVEHVGTLLAHIGKVRWKEIPKDSLLRAWHLGDPALVQALEAAKAPQVREREAANAERLFAAAETDVVPQLAERARLAGASHWRYDGSSGFGLLARPDRDVESPWDRIANRAETLGRPGITGLPISMWAAASVIVDKDGRAARVQMIDGISEPFARAVEQMLIRSTFLPGERKGERVRTRVTLMILAD